MDQIGEKMNHSSIVIIIIIVIIVIVVIIGAVLFFQMKSGNKNSALLKLAALAGFPTASQALGYISFTKSAEFCFKIPHNLSTMFLTFMAILIWYSCIKLICDIYHRLIKYYTTGRYIFNSEVQKPLKVLVEISSGKKVVYATLFNTFVSPGLLRMHVYFDASSSCFRPRVNRSWCTTELYIHPEQRKITLPKTINLPFATGRLV